MSYNKTTWHTGDLVSSGGLNNMEEGIANIDNIEIPELTRGLIGAKASIMISDNGRFKINRYTGSGGTIYTQLIWKGNITLESTGGRKIVAANSETANQINSGSGFTYASYNATTREITITITTNKEIIYKYSTNKIKIQYRDTGMDTSWSTYDPTLQQGRDIDDICLLGVYYQDIYGLALENYLEKQLWDNGGNSSTIPELTRGLIGSKASIMLSDNGRFKVNRYSSSGSNYTQLIWSGNITLESTGGRKTIKAVDAYGAIGDTYATYNSSTSTITITITTNKEIVYKYSTNTIAIQYRDTVTPAQQQWSTYDPNLQQGRDIDDICLLGTYYEDIYGLALENYLEKQLWDGKGKQIEPFQKGITANKATAFLSSDAKFSFYLYTVIESGQITNWKKEISWKNWLYIDLNYYTDPNGNTTSTRVTFLPGPDEAYPNYPDVKTHLGSHATFDPATKTVKVTIATNQEIVYNISTNSLKYQSREARKLDDVVLFGSYYRTTYGILWDEMNRRAVQDSLNSAPYTGLFTDWETPLKRYHASFAGKTNVETFAFYTDAHTMGSSLEGYYEHYYMQYIKQVQKIYNTSACNFIINGGDWLNSNTPHNEALHRLGMIKGFTNSMMRNHHLLVGNHDTNYQGPGWDGTTIPVTKSDDMLTHDEVNNVWFAEENTHKSYYSFDAPQTKIYCFDTWDLEQGMANNGVMGDYENEQAEWFAQSLLNDNPERVICFIHGTYRMQDDTYPNILTYTLTAIANAFNTRNTAFTVKDTTYNFSSCTGRVYFFTAGHRHKPGGPWFDPQNPNATPRAATTYKNHPVPPNDSNKYVINNIPCIISSTRGYRYERAIIDLFLMDYDTNTLYITHADAYNPTGADTMTDSTGSDRIYYLG